jgi:hypothetical protein
MASRTEGLERFRQRVLSRLPEAAKAEIRKANNTNADEFIAGIRRIIPHGDPVNGNLVDTLAKRQGTGTGVIVSIGSKDQPHALHLEAGHKAPDGSHVPPKPFWNPTKRVMRKRIKGRAARAMNKAVKMVSGGA